ncbi:MAG: hypothetical protein N3A68_02725 [Bacteroidia bacterium]|jgi:hypothetical protein|nr:hypothetical protein [Bacteroidia bacterium]GIV23150.1 MAG: hypothetical protein KatS3mg025_0809 [Bacteroidia bacterium]
MSPASLEKTLATYTHPLTGENLPAATLPDLLKSTPLLWLQFLRHLGCIFCKGLVQDTRTFIEKWDRGPKPLLVFIHPNTLEEGKAFFARFYPGAVHIADPELRLYRLFKVGRAKPLLQLHPRNLLHFLSLTKRGLTNDRPTADPLVLQASLLFREGKLIWSYYAKRLSDVPDWRKYP